MSSDTRLLFLAFLIAFSCNWQYGYSSVYLNTPVLQFKEYLNESRNYVLDETSYTYWWDVIQNIWFVGFFLGIWLSPVLNDGLGRKPGVLIAHSFNLLAAIIQFLGVLLFLPVLLIVGRLIASIMTAVAFQGIILYLQECPPTHLRGASCYMSEMCFAGMCVVGMMLGTDQLLGDSLPWLLAVNIPPCALSILIMVFMPETPKYLLIKKNNRDAAEKSILYYYGKDADLDEVCIAMKKEALEDVNSASFRDIPHAFRESHLRMAILLGAASMQITVPIWGVIYNSTLFLLDLDVDDGLAKWSSTAMAALYFIGTIIGSTLIDRLGRRTLLLPCSSISVISLTVLGACFYIENQFAFAKYIAIACFVIFGLVYGIGIGAIAWFIPAELSPQRYRSLVQSISYTMNTIVLVIVTFALLPLYYAFGGAVLVVLYVIPSLISLIFLIFKLPETNGKTTSEILEGLKSGKGSYRDMAAYDNSVTSF